ncbi:MAG: two component transcriptional regulator, winged helix family [Acidobacteriaceae bacterium]|nr:two component transcriptional regulator, winged helix family [Acidobacteriaceae bacterium]
MQNILVIEDDSRVQKTLVRLFEGEGYAVRVESDGLNAVAACRAILPVAVLLDLMLPGVPGREVCKRIKEAHPEIPVLILSAVSHVADKVLLLELGADDYVTKPFSPRELLARVQAAVRRSHKTKREKTFNFGDVSVDFARMELQRAGEAVSLTAHEFKLLRYFIENPGRVISRVELLNDVWGYENYPTTRTVDNQILKLRQKLEIDPAQPKHFRTVHGAGYKFSPA